MKHARPDYNRIQDPAGKIPADEPVFLLRGQDATAAAAVDFYALNLESAGGDAELIRLTREQAQAMRDWPAKKMPDPAPGQDAVVVDSVVEAVRADLLRRSKIGIAKYGTPLDKNPLSLRDWLQHAYEENLDLANYLKCAILELDRKAEAAG